MAPLGLRVLERLVGSEGARRALFLAEPLLLLAAAHYVWTLAHQGEPALGAFVAAAALLGLAGFWLRDLGARLRSP